MSVRSIPLGLRGFDCNFPLSASQAQMMARHGYRYALRYVPRIVQAPHDLTLQEARALLNAGLAIMPVQHVEKDGWNPSAAKGRDYGVQAAASADACGILHGTTVWLDLEGVDLATDAETVIAYCNAWHDEVERAMYLPGIYIGWHAILTPDQLYWKLKFTRYWSAYNYRPDRAPSVVGVCMKQGVAQDLDYPSGWSGQIDTNIVVGDAKDRVPTATAPSSWNVWT